MHRTPPKVQIFFSIIRLYVYCKGWLLYNIPIKFRSLNVILRVYLRRDSTVLSNKEIPDDS